MGNPDRMGISLQVTAHALAQHRIDFICLRERIENGGRRDRAFHHRHVRQDHHPLDLGLHFRLEVEGQVRGDPPAVRN